MFEQVGLPFAGTLDKIPNSRRALMLAEHARDRGAFAQLHPRLYDAYWGRGRDIGDERVLVEEGLAVGLEQGEILDALRDGAYLSRIEAQTRAAIEIGATGVPAWLVDRRVLVPGAQPHELFERVLERLGHPPLDGEAPEPHA
jgi:predicted DsbA family dithiol-disulfide isomerase